jgi:hypothetical protein
MMSFPFLCISNSVQSSLTANIFAKFVCLLKRLQRLKQEWPKSPAGTRQTYGKNSVWFGEMERKLANLSKTRLLTVLPLNYFMVAAQELVLIQYNIL